MPVPGTAIGAPDRLVLHDDRPPSPHSDGPGASAAWYTTTAPNGHVASSPSPDGGNAPQPSHRGARPARGWPDPLPDLSAAPTDGSHATRAPRARRAVAAPPPCQTTWQGGWDASCVADRLFPFPTNARGPPQDMPAPSDLRTRPRCRAP